VTALALALASSLCWGISDFVGGVQSRRLPLLVVMLISQGIGLAGVIVWLAVRGDPPPELVRLLPAAISGAAGLAALTAFYRALSIGTMSIVAPISATGVAVPVIVGVAGGDRPAALQVAGLAAAVVGVVLASREHGPGVDGPTGTEAVAAARTSIGLALVAALGFGSFFVGLRISARADVPWALFAARASGVAFLIGLAVITHRPARGVGGSLAALALVGMLDLAANVTYALATRHGLLSIVAVASSLYPLATVALARLLLGERVRRVQEVGIVTAVLGVALLAAG
jgi:drug/metabolite transporter (DMT)-like permease